jgi:putative redox protein
MPRIALATLTTGMEFVARTNSDHEVRMDTAEEGGGKDTGARPNELPFVGLAGCTGMDVISILRKMRQEVATFQVEIEGVERREEHPKFWTSVRVIFTITGNVEADKIERAIELSRTQYCSVSASLRPGMKIEYVYILNGTEKVMSDEPEKAAETHTEA